MTTNPTNAQITALRAEAVTAGDTRMAAICSLALGERSGWTCRRETVTGQGYLGGDGVRCFRVRSADGLLVDPVATYVYAPYAWASAECAARYYCGQAIRDALAMAD